MLWFEQLMLGCCKKHDLLTAAGIKACSQNSKNQLVERHIRPALYDGTAQRSSTREGKGKASLQNTSAHSNTKKGRNKSGCAESESFVFFTTSGDHHHHLGQ